MQQSGSLGACTASGCSCACAPALVRDALAVAVIGMPQICEGFKHAADHCICLGSSCYRTPPRCLHGGTTASSLLGTAGCIGARIACAIRLRLHYRVATLSSSGAISLGSAVATHGAARQQPAAMLGGTAARLLELSCQPTDKNLGPRTCHQRYNLFLFIQASCFWQASSDALSAPWCRPAGTSETLAHASASTLLHRLAHPLQSCHSCLAATVEFAIRAPPNHGASRRDHGVHGLRGRARP